MRSRRSALGSRERSTRASRIVSIRTFDTRDRNSGRAAARPASTRFVSKSPRMKATVSRVIAAAIRVDSSQPV